MSRPGIVDRSVKAIKDALKSNTFNVYWYATVVGVPKSRRIINARTRKGVLEVRVLSGYNKTLWYPVGPDDTLDLR